MNSQKYMVDYGSEYIIVDDTTHNFILDWIRKDIVSWINITDIRNETYYINLKQIKFIRKCTQGEII